MVAKCLISGHAFRMVARGWWGERFVCMRCGKRKET